MDGRTDALQTPLRLEISTCIGAANDTSGDAQTVSELRVGSSAIVGEAGRGFWGSRASRVSSTGSSGGPTSPEVDRAFTLLDNAAELAGVDMGIAGRLSTMYLNRRVMCMTRLATRTSMKGLDLLLLGAERSFHLDESDEDRPVLISSNSFTACDIVIRSSGRS